MDAADDDQENINNILNKIEPTVKSGNLGAFKDLIHGIHDIKNKTLLSSCYNNRGIDIISLLCEYSNIKLLRYLLHRSHILHYLTNEDKTKELEYKETAFYFAMRSNNFVILEMLYDYWSGDLHWLGHKKEYSEFDVDKLNQLHNLLKNAYIKYVELIVKKEKVDGGMILNIQSLMAFNDFQRDVYEKLNEVKTTLITWEDEPNHIIRIQETHVIRSMILAIIDKYEKYSKKEFSEDFKKNLTQNDDFKNLDDFADDSPDEVKEQAKIMQETYYYATREVYYRKLDSNMCLLILDHLHLLKLRLSMPQDSYQKLENKLYHFYYHVTNNWRLYLPKRKKIEAHYFLGRHEDTKIRFKVNVDSKKWTGIIYIMCYERRDFMKTIKTFKTELKNRHIEEHIRKEKCKLPYEDYNYLKLIPELRDDYSLKIMSRLIGQLYSLDINTDHAVLLIERTLQVVGEFLKYTDESLHLEPSTEALLKAEISVEVINDLKILRNMLCHAKKGILLKRIELEQDNFNTFKAIRNELLEVKRKIDKVIKVHKPLVQRALLLNTKALLFERRNDTPAAVGQVFLYMLTLLDYIPDDYNQFFKKIWSSLKSLQSIAEEVFILLIIYVDQQSKLAGVCKTILNNVINEFPFYRKMIECSLNEITNDKQKWIKIVNAIKHKDSSVNLSDYPNEDDTNRIKSYSKKFDLGEEANKFIEDDMTLFAHIEHHWKFISNLLEFVVIKTCIFKDTVEDLQICTGLKELDEYDYRMNDVKKTVAEYLDKIEERLDIKNKNNTNTNVHLCVQPSEFNGIKELTNKLSKRNFLTKKEKTFLIDILQSNDTISKKKLATRNKMMEKIEKDVPMPMTSYRNFIASENLDEKAQKILINLVMGHERDPLIVQCLSNRISILKDVTANLTVNQLVLRYELDKTFRVLLEILLFDIFDILESNNKNTEIVKKSSKLLMEMNLRNILTHGSPLLDVVGVVLDSNDLPTELVTKAMEFIKDKTSVEALCALRDSGYFSSENNTISADQQEWMIEFKTSPRWKDYIWLVPEYKQAMYEKSKNKPATFDKSTMLLKAVQKKDYLSVQQSIDDGADVNFVDTNNKAVVHYAAMGGDVHIMIMLVNNRADINIKNKENNLTALHYSAMYNFKDAVEFLLENGANCLAVDSKGRTPAYLANQSDFLDISKILLQKMKKCEMLNDK
ncbi:uncharacterized protein [Epargyreus clarus]|uniref:uncharacterized protein n=1 Tax=Epargyreus clarus TaxID=520877 RepID=UPI003C2F2FFA